MKDDVYYMKLALKEAEKAQMLNEVPIGAVIVIDEQDNFDGDIIYGKQSKMHCTC